MIVVDGTNQILGRIAVYAAKKALLGEKVTVINCENVIITGRKEATIKEYKEKVERGDPHKGPFFHKSPDRIVRRTVRGMLPWDKPRGQQAYRKVMCYLGKPSEITGKPITIKGADISKLKTLNYITLERLTLHIGGKH